MTDNTTDNRTQTVHTVVPSRTGSTERVLWWVAFGVLTFGAFMMIGLWN